MKAELDKTKYFGEGLAFLDGKVFQLTYKSKKGFIYDDSTFTEVGTFNIPSKEGWGLTTNSKNLIMSDGTSKLTYLNPQNLKVIKRISVTENGRDLVNLNELEYIKGYIYANVWTTNSIVKINPSNGKVVGRLDLTSLANDARLSNSNALEMNGIAFIPESETVLITGKMWSKIYSIKFDL
ncbi:MAG: glutaminyl-peptide cyclotransferase [Crocinitomicaceae bacterium]|nr:glutaminyl-peptide cyclotransferase [Crocinitomicaceae bacterium]